MSFGERLVRLRRWLGGVVTDARLGLVTGPKASVIAGRSTYLGGGIVMVRVLARHILYLPSRDTSLVPGLLVHGSWEKGVTRVLAAHVRPGMIVADVGANVGYFTVLMADRVGPAGHVHAFEPNPHLVPLIERSLFVNGHAGHVTVHPVPLGAEDGREMMLSMPGDALGGAAISARVDHEVPGSHPVVLRRLDTIPGADRIELIKIDAEGSEPAIWDGMAALIAGTALRTILLEFTAAAYADPGALLDRIAAAGFRVRQVGYHGALSPVSRDRLLSPACAHLPQMLLLTR